MKTKKTLKIALLICGIILSNLTIAQKQFIGDSLISKEIEGCTDTRAINYNPYAIVYLENSCIYKEDSSWAKAGCMDTSAINYNPYATVYLENSCIYKEDSSWAKAGCMDTSAINYNPYATVYLENSCIYKEDSSWAKAGCMDTSAINYNPYATVYLENSCIYKEDSSWAKAGCMDTSAINYNPYATVYLENSCIYKEDSSWAKAGCTDTSAINYNPYATVYLEKSCIYKQDSSWAIVGCTDILSANYNQFATISDNSCQESDYVYNNSDVKIDSIYTNVIETVNNCEIQYGLQIVSANISSIIQNRDTLLTNWSIGILGYDKLITLPVYSFRTLEIDEYVLFKLNISCNTVRSSNSNQYSFVNILSSNEINSRLTNVTSIDNQNIESNKTILNRINLQGQEVDSNYKGLIIIRYTDGSTQKQIQN